MPLLTVRGKRPFYDAQNRLYTQEDVEARRVVSYLLPEDQKVPDYLEVVSQAEAHNMEPVEPPQRTFSTPDERNLAIHQALGELDANDDSHWNQDGQPSMEKVRELVGDSSVTRAEVRAIAPEVLRPARS